VLITIYICVGTLQHANLRWTFGPLGRVLVSPAYHRLHHAPDIQTANLGVVFTIWDVVAGWATFPSRRDGVGRTAWTAVRSRSSRAPPDAGLAAGRRPARRAVPGPRLTRAVRHHDWMVPFSTPPLAALKAGPGPHCRP